MGGLTQIWHRVASPFAVTATLIAAGSVLAQTAPRPDPPQASTGAVSAPAALRPDGQWASEGRQISVVDADTVDLGEVRFRLAGLDAPEIKQAKCQAERERGIVAAARLIALIAQRGATITPEVDARGRPRRDKYGRTLGALNFGDGSVWAAVAVAEGHAIAWDGKGRRPSWCQPPG